MGNLQGRESERRQQTPATYRQTAKAAAERACVGMQGVVLFECVYEKAETGYERAHAEQDLSAQQRAATAAMVSSILALLTVFVSGIGIYYIRRTIKQGQESLKVAREAIAENRRIGEAQVRSYITVTEAAIRWSGDGPIDVRLQVKNSGQSPASDFKLMCWITVKAITSGAEQRFYTENKDLSRTIAAGRKAYLAPQTPEETLRSDIIDALLEDPKGVGIALAVGIDWRDVFGAKRMTSEGFNGLSSQWPIEEFVALPYADHMVAAFRRERIKRKRRKEKEA